MKPNDRFGIGPEGMLQISKQVSLPDRSFTRLFMPEQCGNFYGDSVSSDEYIVKEQVQDAVKLKNLPQEVLFSEINLILNF